MKRLNLVELTLVAGLSALSLGTVANAATMGTTEPPSATVSADTTANARQLGQLRGEVQIVLNDYGFRSVDVNALSPDQLAGIFMVGHKNDDNSQTTESIRSLLMHPDGPTYRHGHARTVSAN